MKDTHPYLPILSTGCQILAIGAEAHAANVQVASLTCFLIHQYALHLMSASSRIDVACDHIPCLLPSLRIIDLRCPITPRSEVLAVRREAYTAHHAIHIRISPSSDKRSMIARQHSPLMHERMHQLDIQAPLARTRNDFLPILPR